MGVRHFECKFQGEGRGHPHRILASKESWAITWCYLCDPTFSRFDTILACDTHADTQTDRQTRDHGYYLRRAMLRAGKKRAFVGYI